MSTLALLLNQFVFFGDPLAYALAVDCGGLGHEGVVAALFVHVNHFELVGHGEMAIGAGCGGHRPRLDYFRNGQNGVALLVHVGGRVIERVRIDLAKVVFSLDPVAYALAINAGQLGHLAEIGTLFIKSNDKQLLTERIRLAYLMVVELRGGSGTHRGQRCTVLAVATNALSASACLNIDQNKMSFNRMEAGNAWPHKKRSRFKLSINDDALHSDWPR
jgi:hypothetical protein